MCKFDLNELAYEEECVVEFASLERRVAVLEQNGNGDYEKEHPDLEGCEPLLPPKTVEVSLEEALQEAHKRIEELEDLLEDEAPFSLSNVSMLLMENGSLWTVADALVPHIRDLEDRLEQVTEILRATQEQYQDLWEWFDSDQQERYLNGERPQVYCRVAHCKNKATHKATIANGGGITYTCSEHIHEALLDGLPVVLELLEV